jgi:hypothetical protein
MAGSHNNINVLQCFHMFSKLVKWQSPPVNYEINGHQYNNEYYFVDGIYPKWTTLLKTISGPTPGKRANFSQRQEACRKDVERAFGVIQARFAMVRLRALT